MFGMAACSVRADKKWFCANKELAAFLDLERERNFHLQLCWPWEIVIAMACGKIVCIRIYPHG